MSGCELGRETVAMNLRLATLLLLLPVLAHAEAPAGRDCISLDGRLVPGGLVYARVAPGTDVALDGPPWLQEASGN